MKKKFIIAGLCILLLFSLTACSKNKKEDSAIPNDVSCVEMNAFWGQSENSFVEIICGEKENALIADGNIGKMSKFVDVGVYLMKADLIGADDNILATLKKDGKEIAKGELKYTNIEDGYRVTIRNTKGYEFDTVSLSYGETNEDVQVTKILQNKIDWNAAYKKAKESFEQAKVKSPDDIGKKNREVFIKIVRNKSEIGGEIYWYVSFLNDTNYWSVLISCENGEILAKKIV